MTQKSIFSKEVQTMTAERVRKFLDEAKELGCTETSIAKIIKVPQSYLSVIKSNNEFLCEVSSTHWYLLTPSSECFNMDYMVEEIKPNQVYTTEEAQDYLKVSNSTIKRLLKKGIIRANKVGGRYKILGNELLRLVSPNKETKFEKLYYRLKNKTKRAISKW